MKSRNRLVASALAVVLVSHQMADSQEPETAKSAVEAGKPAEPAAQPDAAESEPVLPPVFPVEPGDLPTIEPVNEMPMGTSATKLTKDTVVTRTSGAADSQEIPLAGLVLYRDSRMRMTQPQGALPERGAGIFIIEGLTTPKPEELRHKLSAYLGKKATFRDMEKVVEIVLEHYRVNHRPMTHVYLPKQPYSGVMRIAVIEGVVGNATVVTESDVRGKTGLKPQQKSFQKKIDEGSWWQSWYRDPYKADDLKVTLAPRLDRIRGRVVDTEELKAQMAAINRSPWVHLNRPVEHPFREVDVVFSPPAADVLGQTDLVFEVRDTRPLKFFLGYENNLTKQLGDDKIFVGAAWYDAFGLGLDHQLGFQVFSAMDPNQLIGISSSYVIPWKSLDQFTELYGAYAESSANVSISGVGTEISGTNTLFGGRHYIELPEMFGATDFSEPLPLDRRAKVWADPKREAFGLHHEVGAGFDFKAGDNDLAFGGVSTANNPADIVQLVIEYNARQTDPLGETNLGWQLFISPGDITSNNTDESFAPLRSDSSATYIYTKIKLDREQDLPYGLMARAALTGQWSDSNLLASEQLGVGGFDSVRGYPERIHLGDIGYILNLELYSPEYMPCEQWFKWNHHDSLRFLTFFDLGYGQAANDEAADPLDDGATLMSVGAGLRYEFENDLRLRLDYGFQLSDTLPGSDNPDTSAFHLGAVWTF